MKNGTPTEVDDSNDINDDYLCNNQNKEVQFKADVEKETTSSEIDKLVRINEDRSLSSNIEKARIVNETSRPKTFRRSSISRRDNISNIVLINDMEKFNFDATAVTTRLNNFWSLQSQFGGESNLFDVYLLSIVSDRYCLTNGMHLLRDELQLAFSQTSFEDLQKNKSFDQVTTSCCANVSLPSIITTVAHTNCGDRICQSVTAQYVQTIASRFASISERGEYKPEQFNPTGGGTDDGATLAHVTWAHMIDEKLKKQIYNGNATSFALVNFDLMTHCGKTFSSIDEILSDRGEQFRNIPMIYGSARESMWRDARRCCGAVYGTLNSFNPQNAVHVRLRKDLGEDNYEHLSKNQILANDGTPVTYLVAAAIIAIQGLVNTAKALVDEMDERGVAHLTAMVTVNQASIGTSDNVVYLARCTVFQKVIKFQGLGVNSKRYSATVLDNCVVLSYDGRKSDEYDVCVFSTHMPNSLYK